MPLRCLLFSLDEGTAQPICQLLTDLGVEVEHCPAAVQAVERVTSQVFNLVIVDWDNQPEAAFLLNTAREKKAAERPLTLAIVGNDASVPLALQAGANSILRKPVNVNQAKDTLTTARDLLRSKLEAAAAPAAQAAAAGASASSSVSVAPAPVERDTETPASEKVLRAGEFLQSGKTPSAHFVTESEVPKSNDHVAGTEIDPLDELEPMAASVEQEQESAPQPPLRDLDEPRGLSWYLKSRSAPAPPPEPAPEKAALLSYSETPSITEPQPEESADLPAHQPANASTRQATEHEQRTEAELFAYISGETPKEVEPKPRRRFGKLAVIGAVAAILLVAFLEAPQSYWRPKAQAAITRAARAGHNWLNPQPVTTAPAPPSHENFGRAGDEYKLPVAENIPDATTDPSQIRVLPMVDPTAKPPKGSTDAAGQTTPIDTSAKDNPDPAQPDQIEVQENVTPPNQVQEHHVQENPPPESTSTQPSAGVQAQPGSQTQPDPSANHTGAASDAPAQQAHPNAAAPSSPTPRDPLQPITQKTPPPRNTSTVANNSIPSSLKSQMATSTPEASGNKPVEAAMPSIEPVELPEATVRGLLIEHIEPDYPETARGQKGTVILQVLIGRDGSVQDVKFQQGSLAFARAAIDAVKQWRFKPYTLNTHPVSVKSVVSLNFKPAA